MNLTWTGDSLDDLDDIFRYSKKIYTTKNILYEISNNAGNLLNFPQLGKKVYEDDFNTAREIRVYQFIIIYEVHKKEIIILRIIHTRRNFKYS